MENHTAKHFALQLGSLASLYASLVFFLVLVFGMINLIIPDPTDSAWQVRSSSDMVRLGFAMTIVFFPTYLYLTRIVNRNRRDSESGTYLGLTKWLIYLSLLVGGAVLLIDLVVVIYHFLEGELTTRFILKAAAVLLITGAAVSYYLKDAQGYWLTHEKKSLTLGAVAALLVGLTLVSSILYIQTPAEVRERKIDQQQVSDLRDMQWALESYILSNEELPTEIDDVYSSQTVPTAQASRMPYTYERTADGFTLCAEFAFDTYDTERVLPRYRNNPGDQPFIVNPDDWYYEAGEWCFVREVRK